MGLLNRQLGLHGCFPCSRVQRACMFFVLACLRAWRARVFTIMRPYVFASLACLLVLRPYVLTCLTCFLCSSIFCVYVLVYSVSCAFVLFTLHFKSSILKIFIKKNLIFI